MKRIVSISTKGDRPEQLRKAIDSLINQCDELHVYDNSRAVDYTDNAKFYHLHLLQEPCYYFSADDDIIYPSDYIQHTVDLIERYSTIITYHGRILKRPVKTYYKGHDIFDFKGAQLKDVFVDVAGTGVCGFRTDIFNPVDIYKSEYKCMSDLVFSLEARRQNKKIICAARDHNWLIQQPVESGIRQRFGKCEAGQVYLAQKILE